MTTDALAHTFDRAHRESGCWRARCPVHEAGKRYGRALAIYAKDDRSILVCYSGCSSDDILAAVKLTWKDTLYEQRDSKAWRAEQAERRKRDSIAYRARIREWVRLFRAEGYNSYDRDAEVVIATAQIMAVEGEKPHLQQILSVHMERLTAAQFLEGK